MAARADTASTATELLRWELERHRHNERSIHDACADRPDEWNRASTFQYRDELHNGGDDQHAMHDGLDQFAGWLFGHELSGAVSRPWGDSVPAAANGNQVERHVHDNAE